MKIYEHFLSLSRWIRIKWETCQTKVAKEIKKLILCSITFSQISCLLWDNVEKCGKAREVKDDNIVRRMRFACQITKTRIQTHSQNLTLIAFPGQQLREWASMLRVLRALPLLSLLLLLFCRRRCCMLLLLLLLLLAYWAKLLWRKREEHVTARFSHMFILFTSTRFQQ